MTQPAQSQPPQVASQPSPGGTVTPLPEVVISEHSFEGKEVGATLVTLSGAAKIVPQAMQDEHRVLTVDDVLTIQIDVRVTGVGYDVDKNGVLTRVQKMRPIEGTATVLDVVRARDTRIR